MKIMGVDYGKARIGCAVSDALGMIANPVGTVHETYFPKQVQRVAKWVEEHRPERIVVGLPRHMNGDEGVARKWRGILQRRWRKRAACLV